MSLAQREVSIGPARPNAPKTLAFKLIQGGDATFNLEKMSDSNIILEHNEARFVSSPIRVFRGQLHNSERSPWRLLQADIGSLEADHRNCYSRTACHRGCIRDDDQRFRHNHFLETRKVAFLSFPSGITRIRLIAGLESR